MILVDSSVWIAYFNGQITWQTDALDKLLHSEPILIADLILTEVLQGFRTDKDFNQAKAFLSTLVFIEIGGYNSAIISAFNYRLMRKKGITGRKTIDVLIGSYCIENGISLLHDDHDFDPMEQFLGLKVITSDSLH
ncbi:MAG: PIN domain nuclease [Calditrichaeota bacterium]|jgi:predicted nucleic acid-binding protein|nr:PIN domain nuclease [Deltaproteobacteria bacterium]MBT7484098.1 PIN domain nuclease [Candidatus Peregrinibacteria bacterium]MBT7616556.1 PIN domain nuclease [Calditrichota bacterium]MBT4266787.1 PIN domain nuclease [Deltaproteobacteria bacterium]MBT4643751.1 PIN domain nuclease [Deltaproteobacteria bacterium]